jgi:hypothetical protein
MASAKQLVGCAMKFRRNREQSALLVGIEHPLNLVGIRRLRERQRQQQARFPWLQIIPGDEAASL